MARIDVIVPLYKPGKELFALLERLRRQKVKVDRVILMNTEEKYFEELISGTRFWEKYAGFAEVCHLSRREFDHGLTRHLAVQKSDADIFVMMTQDAMPADEGLTEALLGALADERTAVAYARQLPAQDCSPVEQYTRSFNYPDRSGIKTAADIPRLGVKTYFCSNVCAAYKRSVYDELGGFIRHTIFNEDMIYAAGAIKAGYAVAYAAKAKVYHSHNYTNVQQFKRNFDLGVSQADHPEVFAGISSEKEGKKMVLETTGWLRKTGKWFLIPHFYVQCACRYAGFFLGKRYRYLPRFLIVRFTSNRQYWEKN